MTKEIEWKDMMRLDDKGHALLSGFITLLCDLNEQEREYVWRYAKGVADQIAPDVQKIKTTRMTPLQHITDNRKVETLSAPQTTMAELAKEAAARDRVSRPIVPEVKTLTLSDIKTENKAGFTLPNPKPNPNMEWNSDRCGWCGNRLGKSNSKLRKFLRGLHEDWWGQE